jgi:hypothetical protein
MLRNRYSVTFIIKKIKVKALKRYFSYTSGHVVTIPKEMYKLMLKKHNFLQSRKSNKVIGRNVTSYL